jgi:hypothetical protein
MVYRLTPKEKEMRLLLTRGEVRKIVIQHLRETGKIPADAEHGSVDIQAIPKDDGGGYLGPEDKGAETWEDWTCMLITWKEPE